MKSPCCLSVCVCPHICFVFYAVRVVSKENSQLVHPRTSFHIIFQSSPTSVSRFPAQILLNIYHFPIRASCSPVKLPHSLKCIHSGNIIRRFLNLECHIYSVFPLISWRIFQRSRQSSSDLFWDPSNVCKCSGSHVDGCSDCDLLCCHTHLSCRLIATFLRNMLPSSSQLKFEATGTSETLASTYKTTGCHNPEDDNLNPQFFLWCLKYICYRYYV
jgi:hypothetical protein